MAKRQTRGTAAVARVLVAVFLALPLTARAQEPINAGAGLVTEARRLFDTPSLVRTIEADRDLQAMMHAQRSMAGAPHAHFPWKAVLSGACIGALAGGVLVLIAPGGTDGPDYGGGGGMVGAAGAGAAVVFGIVGGAVIGAGIGLVVGLLTNK